MIRDKSLEQRCSKKTISIARDYFSLFITNYIVSYFLRWQGEAQRSPVDKKPRTIFGSRHIHFSSSLITFYPFSRQQQFQLLIRQQPPLLLVSPQMVWVALEKIPTLRMCRHTPQPVLLGQSAYRRPVYSAACSSCLFPPVDFRLSLTMDKYKLTDWPKRFFLLVYAHYV